MGMDVVREVFLAEVIITQTPNGRKGARQADLSEGHSRQTEKHMRTASALSRPLTCLLSQNLALIFK